MTDAPVRVHFAYWGRRGGGARMALDLAHAAVRHPGLSPTISISHGNELFAEFEALGPALFAIDTFASGHGALTRAWRIPALRRALRERLARDRTQAFVTLMPHVWSAALAPAVTRMGIPYTTIVHDGASHPGDRTGLVHGVLMRDCRHADLIVTLSKAVAHALEGQPVATGKRIVTLFSPDMGRSVSGGAREAPPALAFPRNGSGMPLRLAFVGRIMPYKGLPLLVEAVQRVRAQGIDVALGVFGEGDLAPARTGLDALGAEVENRWLSDDELSQILGRHHAVVLAHVEASQSGIVALAGAHGLPVIATPVGGLPEQVLDGQTGLLARSADAEGLAAAIARLARDEGLYNTICSEIRATTNERTFTRFLQKLVGELPLRRDSPEVRLVKRA